MTATGGPLSRNSSVLSFWAKERIVAKSVAVFVGVFLCLGAGVLNAQPQHPDFRGVWRVRGSQPSSENLIMISDAGGTLHLKTFSRQAGHYTVTDAEFVIGETRTGTLQRMAAEFKATWDGNALLLEWAVTWPWGQQSEQHRWTMRGDGMSFHDDSSDTFKTRVRQHATDFDRDSEHRSKLFDLPEQNAGEHFKNVRVLRELPASAMTLLMGTFQVALGVDCQYCHDQGAYDGDLKQAKVRAREMISMTADLNRREFQGRAAVTCSTCHRGKSTPAP
jgi:hypothetical protein